MSREAAAKEGMVESGEDLLEVTVCKADDIVEHSTFIASPMRRLQLMYKLWLSIIFRTSRVSMQNCLLTISTSSTVSTMIDPEAVLLKTLSMMDTLSVFSIVRPWDVSWEKIVL